MSQTVASASTSLATGTIFTIPALFLWGAIPPYLQVVTLAFLGGLLGLSAMIPLRRLLIVKAHDELPYPEGTACAEVLRATTSGASSAASGSVWIFRGMILGAAVKFAISLAYLMPGELHTLLPVLPKAELALEVAPALLGVGYILGYRQAAVCVAGALISAVVITPLIALLRRPHDRAALSRDRATHLGHGRGRHLVALRALHRRGRRGDRGHPHGRARPADDGRRVHRGGPRHAGRRLEVVRHRGSHGPGPARVVRARRNCSRRAGGGTRARRVRRRHERSATRGARRRRRVLRRAVRHGRGPHRRHRRRLVAADLRHHARDAAWNGVDLRCGRLGGRRRARRRPDGRHDRGDRRQQGGRHLAGPEDRMAGRGDTGATAARPADRRRLRVLGGRGDRAAAWRSLRVRLQGDPRAAGHADEDDHRGRAVGRAAVGPRADGRGTLDRCDALRRVGARLRNRRVPAARVDGAALCRWLRARAGRAQARPAARGHERPGHSRGVRARRRRRARGRCRRGSRRGGHRAEVDGSAHRRRRR